MMCLLPYKSHHWLTNDWLSLLCREVKLWLLHEYKTLVCADMCTWVLHVIHWLFTGASQLWSITCSCSDSGQASLYWWCKCTYWELCVCFSTSPESSDDYLCEVIWFSQGLTIVSCWCQPCHRGWCLNADEYDLTVHRGGSYCCKHAFRLRIADMSLIYTRLMWSCLSDLRRIRRMCLALSSVTNWVRSSAALLLTMRLRIRRTLTCKELSSLLRWCIGVHHPNFWNLLSCSQFLKLTLTNTLWVYLFCPTWLSSSCGVECEYS